MARHKFLQHKGLQDCSSRTIKQGDYVCQEYKKQGRRRVLWISPGTG